MNWYLYFLKMLISRITRGIKRNLPDCHDCQIWLLNVDAINLLVDRVLPLVYNLFTTPVNCSTAFIRNANSIHTHTYIDTRARYNKRLAFLVIVKWYGTRFITSLTTLSRCTREIRMSGVRLCNESISMIINFSSVVWIKDRVIVHFINIEIL